MAFIPVPNVWQVELVYSYLSQIVENTLYFSTALTANETNLTALATEVRDWYNTQLRPLQNNSTVLNAIRVRSLESQSALGLEFVTGLPLTGGITNSVAAPGNVTVAVSFLTNFRGRSYRGRNYYVGLSAVQISGNSITTSLQSALRLAYLAILADVNPTDFDWVVVSRYTNNAPRVSGIATPITGVKIDISLDSQRRRLHGRGD